MSADKIKKALECCVASPFCGKDTDCPYKGLADCHKKSTYDAIDLINRLNEENEGLTAELEEERKNFSILMNLYKQAKSEAYKEFAELCKKEVPPYSRAIIDNLLKEMG